MNDLREHLDRIEYRITQGMTAAQCFTQMKQLLTPDNGRTARGAVPGGWDIRRTEFGGIRVGSPDGSWLNMPSTIPQSGHHSLEMRLLYALAEAMLAAAPQPVGEVGPRHDHLVPGVMRCAKCAFQLHRVTLYVRSGTTGAGDSDTEPCPNGCGPLWPVTWRQWAEEAQEYAQRLQGELDALKAEPAPSAPAAITPEREAMSRMKDRAMEAHRLCYEAMLAHPEIATLGDDGELHKAIHAIVGVDTPSYVAPADVEALACELGAKGSPANEQDRLAFEAWMRGHCWSLCATWRDGCYRSDAEAGGGLCPDAMNTRRLWAAWRDRGELSRRLSGAQQAKDGV